MFKLCILVVATLGMTVFACSAHELSIDEVAGKASDEVSSSAEASQHGFESLIRFNPDAEPPFQLNEAAAKSLRKEDDELADVAFFAILQQMAELVAEYPDSPAAQQATQVALDSGYVITRHGRLYPKGAMELGPVILVR